VIEERVRDQRYKGQEGRHPAKGDASYIIHEPRRGHNLMGAGY
jgi:hypothetical protein